ncbi:DUF1289 domain-containing protein [Geopseudomonas guangdongensis]|uniref:Fe-S protein n=1 Tax=Geopseudomonas guangdongensis TaxID=1245526 RepID=A0A1H2FH55_9GAMM|nr:DUF1289 domain-containing protein [Pseudomonas guangdongensis]SDU06278.1 hypothetical protein SAMN05216580_1193 [Pseudomonas guangdongensis]
MRSEGAGAPRDAEGRIASPCVGSCGLDARDVCRGCGRLREEIRQWRGADDALRLEIRALAEARQAG